MNAISDKLKSPILVFESCNNLAGYSCIAGVSNLQDDDQYTGIKIICLTKNDTRFDMLVVLDSKEIYFQNRVGELLYHFTNYQLKVINYFHYSYIMLVSYLFILGGRW